MVKLRENPRLERFLAIVSLVIIALNFIICIIVIEVKKDDIAKKEVIKKNTDSPTSKKQHIADSNKKEAFH